MTKLRENVRVCDEISDKLNELWVDGAVEGYNKKMFHSCRNFVMLAYIGASVLLGSAVGITA